MSEVIKRLDEAEKARLDTQVQAIANAPLSKVDVHSGKQFVFVAHFDGTNNDKDNVALSGNPLPTNVAELWGQMKPLEAGNDNFRTEYYRGVGTDPGLKGYGDVVLPSVEMRATAQRAYRNFQKEASDWLRTHPEANPAESLKVFATGFSRGGGTAAVFSQLLYENGLTDPKTGKVLVPPGQLGLAGAMIHEPVTTGYDGNSAFSPTSKNITVVQAQNEYRTLFKGVDHSGHPGVTVVPVAGNHCNIGGGHDRGIGARVLQASTEALQKTGLPIQDVPPHKRTDGSATVHHERDVPKTDQAIEASRRPLVRSAFPIASQVAEAAARATDYPVTHEPRKGLDASRELDASAGQERQRADGWRRFNGVDGAVWRKDYVNDKGIPLTAVMVERDRPGTVNDRVDLFLIRQDRSGEALMNKILPAGSGPVLRKALDQKLAPTLHSHAATEQQTEHAKRFKEQLGPQLKSLGMSEQQIERLTAAAAKEATRYADQGEVSEFLLKKDGSGIAMRQEDEPLREFNVAEALGKSAQAHWQEAAAMGVEQTHNDGDGMTFAPSTRSEHGVRMI